MTKLETTSKVLRIRNLNTDDETAKIIGVSKNTMYSRLKKHNWKVTEISHIEKLKL